jgi:transcriptional regulator with XRE-family HTH domain
MHLSQSELANRLGVRREVVTRIETGKRNISCRLIRQLSELSGVRAADIRANVCLLDRQRDQERKRILQQLLENERFLSEPKNVEMLMNSLRGGPLLRGSLLSPAKPL